MELELLQDMFVNTFSTWTQSGLWTNFSWEYYENPGSGLDFAVMHVNHYHSIPRYSFFPTLSKSMLTNEYEPTAGIPW